jgi:hypothetical protein
MILPVSFKVPLKQFKECMDWVDENNLGSNSSAEWPAGIITFEYEADAFLFQLTHGVTRYYTRAEIMARETHEEDTN